SGRLVAVHTILEGYGCKGSCTEIFDKDLSFFTNRVLPVVGNIAVRTDNSLDACIYAFVIIPEEENISGYLIGSLGIGTCIVVILEIHIQVEAAVSNSSAADRMDTGLYKVTRTPVGPAIYPGAGLRVQE